MESKNKAWFMHENHTFTKLGDIPVDEAIAKISEFLVNELGFVGYKRDGESKSYQFKRTDEWEPVVRSMLNEQVD